MSKVKDAVRLMLEAAGVRPGTVAAVEAVLENDGLAPTGVACRALGLSRWTLERLCARHGVRREARRGRAGCLVDLDGAREAARAEGLAV